MNRKRWGIAAAGFFLQVALGAVYAWSVFRAPLAKQFGWSISEITLTFTISIFVLGIAAFFGGLWLNRKMACPKQAKKLGPRANDLPA